MIKRNESLLGIFVKTGDKSEYTTGIRPLSDTDVKTTSPTESDNERTEYTRAPGHG